MKFAKQLETEAEDIPSEWRPYLIQYKSLKKIITKVAEEIESRGLSTSLLHECLDEDLPHDDTEEIPKIKYYFTGKRKILNFCIVFNSLLLGEAPNIRPNIEFIYNPKEPKIQQLLSKLLHQQQQQERPTLEYKHSQNNKDFFTLAHPEATIRRRRRSSASTLVKELLNLTLEEKDRTRKDPDQPTADTTDTQAERKTLVIELEQDDEFFKLLLKELAQAADLQSVTEQKFQHNISDLESRMTRVVTHTI